MEHKVVIKRFFKQILIKRLTLTNPFLNGMTLNSLISYVYLPFVYAWIALMNYDGHKYSTKILTDNDINSKYLQCDAPYRSHPTNFFTSVLS